MNTPDYRKQFQDETGQGAIITGTDGVHCVLISAANPKYVEWMEKRLAVAEEKVQCPLCGAYKSKRITNERFSCNDCGEYWDQV